MTSADPDLTELGWTAERAEAFAPHASDDLIPGRVVASGGFSTAVTADGATEVIVQRAFSRAAAVRTEMPAIGDWLALAPQPTTVPQAAVRAVLPRSGTFIRQRLSDGKPQVLAANVDMAFLVSGLDQDLNLRRIERYLVLALDGGVTPVIVLNKADLAVDLAAHIEAVDAVASGTRILVTSAASGDGLAVIRALIEPGMTACLLGSSGVGKSSITNALLGEQRQAVKASREDDSKGRHTTSNRELFLLPDGGMLIDTPGLRTVGVLGDSASVEASFSEIEELAVQCRFSDCQHLSEPGCAVLAAIEAGSLSIERLDSQHKLEAEQRSAELRADARAQRETDRSRSRFYRRSGKDAIRFKRGD